MLRPCRKPLKWCPYYKYVLGRIWSELVELFPDRWSAKYFGGLHVRLHSWGLHGLKITMSLLSYSFPCKPDGRNMLSVNCNSITKQQLPGEEWYHIIIRIKLFNSYFYSVLIFVFFPSGCFLLMAVSACIRPLIQIVPPKVSQAGASILQLKVHDI